MTVWTPATQQNETWTAEIDAKPVFSQLVFSHAFYNSKRVFSLGKSGNVWDKSIKQTETWAAE